MREEQVSGFGPQTESPLLGAKGAVWRWMVPITGKSNRKTLGPKPKKAEGKRKPRSTKAGDRASKISRPPDDMKLEKPRQNDRTSTKRKAVRKKKKEGAEAQQRRYSLGRNQGRNTAVAGDVVKIKTEAAQQHDLGRQRGGGINYAQTEPNGRPKKKTNCPSLRFKDKGSKRAGIYEPL